MPKVYAKDKVQQFLDAKQVALQTRLEIFTEITSALPALLLTLEQFESEINEALRTLNTKEFLKARSTKRLVYSWENISKSGNPFKAPRGPSFFIAEKQFNTPPSRIERPNNALLRRVYQDEVFTNVRDARDLVMRLKSRRDAITAYLGEFYRLYKSPELAGLQGCKSTLKRFTAPIPRNMPDHVHEALHERRHWLARIVEQENSTYDLLLNVEANLDDAMMNVNKLGGKNRNLVISWVLPKNTSKTVYGLLGPYWYTLGQSRSSRNKNRLPSNQPVNRDLIRNCFQKRNEAVILHLAKTIKKLSSERDQILRTHHRIYRTTLMFQKKEKLI